MFPFSVPTLRLYETGVTFAPFEWVAAVVPFAPRATVIGLLHEPPHVTVICSLSTMTMSLLWKAVGVVTLIVLWPTLVIAAVRVVAAVSAPFVAVAVADVSTIVVGVRHWPFESSPPPWSPEGEPRPNQQ